MSPPPNNNCPPGRDYVGAEPCIVRIVQCAPANNDPGTE